MEVAINLKELHAAQLEVLEGMRRFTVVVCGRRWGKTDLAVDVVTDDLLNGFKVGYFVPTYRTLLDVWREFKRILKPVTREVRNDTWRLELVTGGVLEMWSTTKAVRENMRGRHYHRIVVDEAAFVPGLFDWWTTTIRPLLADYEGSALFLCSPKGTGNDFYKLYMFGLDPDLPQWASFRYPTSANPYILPGEIEDARKTLPDLAFRQEWLAEFVADAGGVFRGVMAAATVPMRPGREREHRYVAGLDFGRDYDKTAISIIDITTGQQVFRDHFGLTSWELIYERIQKICVRFQVETVIAEQNSIGSQGIEWMQARGLPVQPFLTTNESKRGIIDALALAIETGGLPICNDPYQTAELQAYQYEILPSGKFRFNAPSGIHDDTVIALALSYYGYNMTKSRGRYLY